MENFLKKRQLIPVLVVAIMSCLTLTSCGKDDDDDDEPQNSNPSELIVGKWICNNDAYGYPWEEPLVCQFDSDGSGYQWFQDEPFSYRWEFSYTITESKLYIKTTDRDTYNLRYVISNKGKNLVIYGWDDDDMEELHYVKSE